MRKEFAAVFVDGMSSKGWKVGKEICKDWKAAFRTWAAKEWNQQYRINQLKNNPRVITADTEL
jgi:hypothetical protein